MKKYLLMAVILLMGLTFTSCNKEEAKPNEQIKVDEVNFEKAILPPATVKFYSKEYGNKKTLRNTASFDYNATVNFYTSLGPNDSYGMGADVWYEDSFSYLNVDPIWDPTPNGEFTRFDFRVSPINYSNIQKVYLEFDIPMLNNGYDHRVIWVYTINSNSGFWNILLTDVDGNNMAALNALMTNGFNIDLGSNPTLDDHGLASVVQVHVHYAD